LPGPVFFCPAKTSSADARERAAPIKQSMGDRV
jgi:hypothetical protein